MTAPRTSHKGVMPKTPAGSTPAAVELEPAVSEDAGARLGWTRAGAEAPGSGAISKAGARAQPLWQVPWAGQVLHLGLM